MTFGTQLKAARIAAKKTQGDIAGLFGISPQAVSAWERDENGPEFSRVIKIADFLGVPVDALSADRGESVIGYAQQSTGANQRAPLIDRVAAGSWRLIIDSGQRDAYPRSFELSRKSVGEPFALEIESESMLPDFKEGDIIIIDSALEPRPGDFVVAKLDREEKATFKKYRPRGEDADGYPVVELAPLNPDYPTLTMNVSNPGRVVGVMIEHRRLRR